MEEPEVEISEEEIELEAKNHPYYSRTIVFLQPEQLRASFWEMLKQQIKVSKLKKISDEAMIFDENGNKNMLFPLRNVEPDFNTFRELVAEIIPQIKSVACTESDS